MQRTRSRLRWPIAALAAAAAALGSFSAATPAGAAGTPPTATITSGQAVVPLSPELEAIRAAEATKIYGSPEERPLAQRKTGLISLGDSQISGEGVGTYESPTNGPTNWCHRSPDAAIHRTQIPADLTFNVACSGANSGNIRIGGTKQYADELVQSDNLAIKARNTRVKMVLLVIGANDDLQFGPVMTDCVQRFVFSQGACKDKYQAGWQARIDGLTPKVATAARDLRTVMRDAGYAEADYKLVVMGYPSPIGPDLRDNPDFPGKLLCGGMVYDADLQWGRDGAVPAFERGMRQAASAAGAVYLDNSRLFQGHEVCSDNTWARGLYVDLTKPGMPDANSVRQSFHPNQRGHGAFASCLTQIYNSNLREASCADVNSSGTPALFPLAWDDVFKPLKNAATGNCLDADGGLSVNDTAVLGWDCNGGRNQDWWYDSARGTVHTALSQDRCVDVPDSAYKAGTGLVLWDCHGGANQKFVRDGATLRPASATGLCLTQGAAKEPVRLRNCDGSANQRFV
ncbi:ricin-type beta-trefoil lectin domain protein [Streptomyces laurentii]|uniref:ricin-type beta-trefoil lectin domain protein n=1 Tax=Streptomyces laurentii TaxID=39478 RepID=UPI0036C60694